MVNDDENYFLDDSNNVSMNLACVKYCCCAKNAQNILNRHVCLGL